MIDWIIIIKDVENYIPIIKKNRIESIVVLLDRILKLNSTTNSCLLKGVDI